MKLEIQKKSNGDPVLVTDITICMNGISAVKEKRAGEAPRNMESSTFATVANKGDTLSDVFGIAASTIAECSHVPDYVSFHGLAALMTEDESKYVLTSDHGSGAIHRPTCSLELIIKDNQLTIEAVGNDRFSDVEMVVPDEVHALLLEHATKANIIQG